jgi:hypothetical protein
MMLGMSLSTFTMVHVIISLIGIVSGFIVLSGFLSAKPLNGLTALFLLTTVLTSVTGFGFPFDASHPSPAIKVGILSLMLLAAAIVARYALHMAGVWRSIYVVCASLALYFNVFVLVVQSFLTIPALHALAPTQKEPPFAVAQLLVLAIFVVLTVLAVRRFRLGPVSAAQSNGKAA